MNETAMRLSFGNVQALLYTTENARRVVYVHAGEEQAAALWQTVKPAGAALVCVFGEDWNRDLSPWPAEKVFRQGEDFAGGAPAYLQFWQKTLLPAAEVALGFAPKERIVAGYSLAGLFALHAAAETGLFWGAVSASGSLWFDGWLAYLAEKTLPASWRQVYLSLGDKEKNARNPRMAMVEDCTAAAAEQLQRRGLQVQSEQNPGGHFNEPIARLAKGIAALLV